MKFRGPMPPSHKERLVEWLNVSRLGGRDEFQHLHPSFAFAGQGVNPGKVPQHAGPVRTNNGLGRTKDSKLFGNGKSVAVGILARKDHQFVFWSVVPDHGISNRFNDSGFQRRFHLSSVQSPVRLTAVIHHGAWLTDPRWWMFGSDPVSEIIVGSTTTQHERKSQGLVDNQVTDNPVRFAHLDPNNALVKVGIQKGQDFVCQGVVVEQKVRLVRDLGFQVGNGG